MDKNNTSALAQRHRNILMLCNDYCAVSIDIDTPFQSEAWARVLTQQ